MLVSVLPDWAFGHGVGTLSIEEGILLRAIPTQRVLRRMALLASVRRYFRSFGGLMVSWFHSIRLLCNEAVEPVQLFFIEFGYGSGAGNGNEVAELDNVHGAAQYFDVVYWGIVNASPV